MENGTRIPQMLRIDADKKFKKESVKICPICVFSVLLMLLTVTACEFEE